MAELRQRMTQKMAQKLSPQQIQLMKLLQVPTYALEQRIQEELEANPALEEDHDKTNEEFAETESSDTDDTYELDDYLEEYMEEDPSSYRYQQQGSSMDESDRRRLAVFEKTFHDFLIQQLRMQNITDPRRRLVAEQIIGSIDDDGYLRREPMSIMDDLMFSQNVDTTEEEIKELLEMIQRFEPSGVGARDLQECLQIQLNQIRSADAYEEDPATELAHIIMEQYFDAFSKKHYEKLMKHLEISSEELKAAMDVILHLNPKPASAFSSGNSRSEQYIVPDFIIQNRDGELVLSLNGINAPELHINNQYQQMLRTYKDQKKNDSGPGRKQKEAVVFIKNKIDTARWFIDAIRQRQQTMYKTMYAIMQYQYDFFVSGDESKLKPMILKDIAEVTGLDISTISRVASAKYVQTEFGTRRLKDFFSESMQKQNGEEVSTLEIKHLLGQIVDSENKRKPLSDQKLMQALKEKGYEVARRTVAKYREQLSIPVARLRKEL
jgi:RNA polymerase sigma-54 factor